MVTLQGRHLDVLNLGTRSLAKTSLDRPGNRVLSIGADSALLTLAVIPLAALECDRVRPRATAVLAQVNEARCGYTDTVRRYACTDRRWHTHRGADHRDREETASSCDRPADGRLVKAGSYGSDVPDSTGRDGRPSSLKPGRGVGPGGRRAARRSGRHAG